MKNVEMLFTREVVTTKMIEGLDEKIFSSFTLSAHIILTWIAHKEDKFVTM